MGGIRLLRFRALELSRLASIKLPPLALSPTALPVTTPSAVTSDPAFALPNLSPSFSQGWQRFSRHLRFALTAPALLMLGIPNDTALSTRRVGTPPARDLPFLLEHLAPMIQRGWFADHPTIANGLAMVFEILAQGTTPDDTHLLHAIVCARDAAQIFKDARFLDMARQGAWALSSDTQQVVLADLETTAAEIRPLQLPDHLIQQLRANIQREDELRVEDSVNQLCAAIMDTCLKLIALWKDPEKAISFAEHQITEVARITREAAVSVAKRSMVHDAINLLNLFKSFIRLTAAEEPGRLAASGITEPTISGDVGITITSLVDMHKSSAHLTATGFQGEQLAETADGRDLFVILRNLVGNARQHPRDGQGAVDIHLTLTKSAAGTTITVADNGAGMTAETSAHLLAGRPMHDGQTVDHSNPNEFHGFGWMRIREACAKLGIFPEIESTPGQGTTVTLHLPRGLLKSDTPPPAEQAARARLKDPDPVVQWEAWKELYALNPAAARAVTQADLGAAIPIVIGNGVPVYALRMPQLLKRAREIGQKWINARYPNEAWQLVRVDLATVHPSESLMDFMPAPFTNHYRNSPVMQRYVGHLKKLASEYPNDPQNIERFLIKRWNSDEPNTSVNIIQLPSGLRIIRNGHHRLAALVFAAREGIIPHAWLKEVPVEALAIDRDFPIPEPVFLQIYAPAHKLTLDDLLPPHIPQPR